MTNDGALDWTRTSIGPFRRRLTIQLVHERMLEAPAGAAPAHGGFADRRVPVSPRGQIARANRRLAFPAGLEPAYLRVRSALLIQLSYGKMNMVLPAGLEPASTAREAGILAARRWQPVDFFRPQWKLLPVRRPKSGPGSEVVDWLPPHDSNVPSSVNSGAPSPRWLDGNEMVEQRRVELRTSILQGSTAARCLPRNGAQRQI